MRRFIEYIKSKPESTRKSITFFTSLGITGFIAFFWFISFVQQSAAVLSGDSPLTPNQNKTIESPLKFLSSISGIIGESYANVRSKVRFFESDGDTVASTSLVAAPEEGSFSSAGADTAAASASTSGAQSASPSNNSNAPKLEDILNTKKSVNQESAATTSGEVLVQ